MSSHWPGVLPDPCEPRATCGACWRARTPPAPRPCTTCTATSPSPRTVRRWLAEQNVRFDITVIPPGAVGGEYVKTKGHYHPLTPAGIGYPELYQVLAGEAHYLLQRKNLRDVVVVTAKAGEFVLIPPGYGHVTVNPGKENLVMANPGLGRVRERVCAL
ncbi:glucose-6-phosphate isomerase family protein [Methanoculleus frigidifontis]|uniref:glucose-6-phosphate isomerase family protein n=1 Tax=Methanoculleus frigidifontis TaxID=2584085 RepID=UPI00265B1136|nr:glucose-6-phosphate isomerase family protein [Methanoculleus sp. FWC-SCC1]